MKTERNFFEILEEISDITSESTHTDDMSAGWESALEPMGLSQIIGTIPIYKTGYKKYTSVKKVSGPIKQVRAPHAMNTEQQLAFENLSIWAQALTNDFNRIELKSCYRSALLKTHPDQGGCSESFLLIKKSYEILKSLAKS